VTAAASFVVGPATTLSPTAQGVASSGGYSRRWALAPRGGESEGIAVALSPYAPDRSTRRYALAVDVVLGDSVWVVLDAPTCWLR
jgi:hypothetical protein